MSQICAARLSVPDDPRLFTAGVLHDIGKMVMGEFVEEAWLQIGNSRRGNSTPSWRPMEEVLGVNHACWAVRSH
jgi:HD-like signal output (HDOD) protein